MKTAWAAVITAAAASLCCIGPVMAVIMGVGAIGAMAIRFEPFRPVFLAITFVLLGLAFYGTYRPEPGTCAPESTCASSARRRARVVVWIAAAVVLLFIAFPYYIERLL